MHCFYLVATLVHVTHGLINPKAKVAAPLVPTSGNVGSFSVADEKLPVAAVAVILIPGTNRMMVYDRPTQLGGTVLMDDNNKPTNSIQYDYKSKKFHPVGQSWEKQPEWVPFCSAGIVIPGGTGTEIITFGGVKANGVYTYDDNIGKSWNVKQYIESPRYYAGVVTLPSGHVMISGGGYDHVSDKALPDPGMTTIEFLPATKENFKVQLPVLSKAVLGPYYPHQIVLPNGKVFMLIQSHAIVMDPNVAMNVWSTKDNVIMPENDAEGSTKSLPDLPGGLYGFPAVAMVNLLPLMPGDDDIAATIIVCGGTSAFNFEGWRKETDVKAISSCWTIKPLVSAPAWEKHEDMPIPRNNGDFIWLPDGTAIVVNGGQTGSVSFETLGTPVKQALLYDPFSSQKKWKPLASTEIARYYHSSATLLPDGTIWIAGSTPCYWANTFPCPNSEAGFSGELRSEIFTPPYLKDVDNSSRPVLKLSESFWDYGKSYTFTVSSVSTSDSHKVSLVAATYVTHAQHFNQRIVFLNCTVSSTNNGLSVTVLSPKNANIAPPNWFMLTFIDGKTGVPSESRWISLGSDTAGLANMAFVDKSGQGHTPPTVTTNNAYLNGIVSTPPAPTVNDPTVNSPSNSSSNNALNFLLVGDSYTFGITPLATTPQTFNHTPPYLSIESLWKTSGCRGTPQFTSAGYAGMPSDITVKVFNGAFSKGTFDILILQSGLKASDAYTHGSADEIVKNLQTIADTASSKGTKVILLTLPIFLNTFPGLDDFYSIVKEANIKMKTMKNVDLLIDINLFLSKSDMCNTPGDADHVTWQAYQRLGQEEFKQGKDHGLFCSTTQNNLPDLPSTPPVSSFPPSSPSAPISTSSTVPIFSTKQSASPHPPYPPVSAPLSSSCQKDATKYKPVCVDSVGTYFADLTKKIAICYQDGLDPSRKLGCCPGDTGSVCNPK